MVYISCGNNNEVVSKVVLVVEISNVVGIKSLNYIHVSMSGLSKHALSISIEMDILEEYFFILLLGSGIVMV